MADTLKSLLQAEAAKAGFDVVRVSRADSIPHAAEALAAFLRENRHGDMDWMAETAGRRASPRALWPAARSAILLGLNYGPATDPLAGLAHRGRAVISCYAQGKDYHDVVKGKLKHVAAAFARAAGAEVKVFVDTAPLMEKPLAAAAGLGWQGKHTNLVSREFGSWLFLGAILTTAELAPDTPETDHCGSCQRCLDICPTKAFPAPYQLDARRCISYLTIEHKGHIPSEFRIPIGNRIFGCDDCLAVCPWNKYAQQGREARLHPRAGLANPPLAELLQLNEAGFRSWFANTPIRRAGTTRFLRNILIAAGNSADAQLLPLIVPHLSNASPLVRAMAVWASLRLASEPERESLESRYLPQETDANVRSEWRTEGPQ